MTTEHTQHQFRVGVEYRSEKQSNGMYAIFDVPIFSETKDMRRGRKISYDAAWIQAAAKEHRRQEEKDRNAPSLHYGHNEQGVGEKNKIGEVVNFRSGKLNGKETIFVDIIDLDPEIYQKVQKGRLPHISVEIPEPSIPRIGSVAFLSSRAPYFTLPNILVEEKPEAEYAACFYSSESAKTEIISNFFLQEKSMPRYQDEMPPEEAIEEAPEEAIEEPGTDLESRIADLEARVSALEGADSPESEEAPVPLVEGGEAEMSYGESRQFSAVMAELKNMKKQLLTTFSYTRNLEKEKNIASAVRMAEQKGKVFDSEKFAQQCDYYICNADPIVAQKAINDLIEALPIGTGLTGRRYYAGAQDSDASKFSQEYIADPEEYRVATEAARQAMAMGEDPKRWVRGEINKHRYYQGTLYQKGNQ